MIKHKTAAISLAIFVAITALTGCTAMSKGKTRPHRVEPIDAPKNLVFSRDRAIAYRVAGKAGTVIRDVEFSTRPLISRDVKAPAGFAIYEQSGENYIAVAHQQRGDRLIADVIAGRTYIIAPALTGHLRVSLLALCRLTIEEPRRPAADIPRICTQILCGSQPFLAGSLVDRFGSLPEGMSPSLELGGWDPIPRDLCEACTRPGGGSDDPPTISLVCPAAPAPECDGQVLFNDDFESDSVGSAPASSPAGPPPGDAVSTSGNVTVVNAASRAVRLSRSSQPAVFEGIFGSGATDTGSYCVRFVGQSGVDMREPVIMTFNAANSASAWQLVIDDNEAVLTSGGVRFILLRDFTVPRSFRFDVNLDLKRFDMFVDGTQVVSNMPFLDTSFDVPSDVRFETGRCILECFTAEYTLDDVRVTKTN